MIFVKGYNLLMEFIITDHQVICLFSYQIDNNKFMKFSMRFIDFFNEVM
jgi:hypothetical protein